MVCVIVLIVSLLISCAPDCVNTTNPPACPVWSEEAINELVALLELQSEGEIDMTSLEWQLGENLRHCEALDAFLDNDK